jgi:phospholipase C
VGELYPQRTFFDQVAEAGLEWKNYYNDTPWELFMAGIAHNPDNVRQMDAFWEDAQEGTLPAFAWVNPRSGINVSTGVGATDQHPDHDVAAGEALIKAV